MKLNKTVKFTIGGALGLIFPFFILALTGLAVYFTRDIFMSWGFEVMVGLIAMFGAFIVEMNFKLKEKEVIPYNVIFFAVAAVSRFLIMPPVVDAWLAANYKEIFTEEQFIVMEMQEWTLYQNTITVALALMLIIQFFVILSKFRAPEPKN